MTRFQFIRLLRMIYGPGPVDISWIQSQGLLAVKIGQVHALRLDFLPVEKCEQLSRLYRRNDDIPAERVLEKLDRTRFDSIEERPLASASVGQVHRAVYRGRPVAVKIIKQDFHASFVRDVAAVRSTMRAALFFYPRLARVFDPMGIIEHIEDYTLRELDLRQEIEGQDTLRKIADDNRGRFDLSRLAFPEIFREVSDRGIMVSELVPGRTFDELLDEKKLDYDELLELFRLHGFYLFRVGTFHGDIHPGNIMLHDGRIWFVDTGAISHASTRLSTGLLDFFDALSLDDYPACAERLNAMAEEGIDGAAFVRFREKFIDLYRDFKGATVAEVSLTRKMMETIKLGVNSGMRFEQGMFPIIKSLMYLDGMVLRCNPRAVLLPDMRRFMDQLRG